ncbi:hypothetical protein [Saccharothrix texasensis]|uniref:Uncharacterized protein n=1 Tax=Saccharothrix texasensis TaxID=103734 RepID=A0A3N1HIA8_9PSEU|nr:hypothetical protein [Saccharothrix texasensis]ROP42230.1 hypothetical protein EDD40_7727 [Saccharothrix texasensis]
MRQVGLYLAQHLSTSPWPALATITVLSIALGWPNVIYMDDIRMDFQPA